MWLRAVPAIPASLRRFACAPIKANRLAVRGHFSEGCPDNVRYQDGNRRRFRRSVRIGLAESSGAIRRTGAGLPRWQPPARAAAERGGGARFARGLGAVGGGLRCELTMQVKAVSKPGGGGAPRARRPHPRYGRAGGRRGRRAPSHSPFRVELGGRSVLDVGAASPDSAGRAKRGGGFVSARGSQRPHFAAAFPPAVGGRARGTEVGRAQRARRARGCRRSQAGRSPEARGRPVVARGTGRDRRCGWASTVGMSAIATGLLPISSRHPAERGVRFIHTPAQPGYRYR